MAFNMNRSIIKGTKLHKASVVKAKQSTVSQARMQADPGLVKAGRDLGLSYVPGAIDFSLGTKADLDFKREKEKEKEKTGDYVLGCMDSKANNYSAAATKDDGNCTYDETPPEVTDDREMGPVITEEDINEMNRNATIGVDGDGDGDGDGSGDGAGTSNYVEEEEDADYTDEDIEADLARIGGVSPQPTEFTNEEWEAEQEQEAIRAANELQARMNAESRLRSNAALSILPSRSINNMPTNNNLTSAPQMIEVADINSQHVVPAHLDKNYNRPKQKPNREFNNLNLSIEQDVHEEYYTDLGLDPMNIKSSENYDINGYEYSRVIDANGVEHDMWSYNNKSITDDQVGTEEYTAVMTEVAKKQKDEYEKELLKKEQNLNSNTPKNESTETELLPQPQSENTDSTEITEKPRMSDFEGNWFQRAAQYKEAMRAYKEKYDVKYKKAPTQRRVKSEAELRDDKIFKNAVPGGIAQQTMLKNGYKNK